MKIIKITPLRHLITTVVAGVGLCSCQNASRPLPPTQPVPEDLKQSLLDTACDEATRARLEEQIETNSRFFSPREMEKYLQNTKESMESVKCTN